LATIAEPDIQINLQHLVPGVYALRLTDREGKSVRHLFTKQ
jgi:hypothetical protein